MALLLIGLLAAATWHYWRQGPTIAPGSVLLVTLTGSYPEAPVVRFWSRLLVPQPTTLPEVLAIFHKAAADNRLRAVVIRMTELDIGWAKATDIRDAILGVRRSGKTTVALLEQELGNANIPYFVASACERVYAVPGGNVALRGLAARYVFLGGLWEQLHIHMDVEKMAEYKTAGDLLAGKEMTPAHREMATSLLDSVSDFYLGTISLARSLPVERLRTIIEEVGPSGVAALEEARLLDGAKYWEDVRTEFVAEDHHLVVDDRTYARVPMSRLGLGQGPAIAVILAVGTILPGESHTTATGPVAGADSLRQALEQASQDKRIRAIVLRVDSPGGSAMASDAIWRAVQEARRHKPVIASFSDVAASGGYYIASGATRIVAQATSLTGSIGVVLARPNIQDLLAHWGIRTETLARGRYALIDDVTVPLTDEGRARLRAEVEAIYDLFLRRVSDGRGLPKQRVHEVGRGRVWTGSQARDSGLVDALGGFYAAVDIAKQEAGIPPEVDPHLIFLPAPKSWLAAVEEALEAKMATRLPSAARGFLARLSVAAEGGPAAILPAPVELR